MSLAYDIGWVYWSVSCCAGAYAEEDIGPHATCSNLRHCIALAFVPNGLCHPSPPQLHCSSTVDGQIGCDLSRVKDETGAHDGRSPGGPNPGAVNAMNGLVGGRGRAWCGGGASFASEMGGLKILRRSTTQVPATRILWSGSTPRHLLSKSTPLQLLSIVEWEPGPLVRLSTHPGSR